MPLSRTSESGIMEVRYESQQEDSDDKEVAHGESIEPSSVPKLGYTQAKERRIAETPDRAKLHGAWKDHGPSTTHCVIGSSSQDGRFPCMVLRTEGLDAQEAPAVLSPLFGDTEVLGDVHGETIWLRLLTAESRFALDARRRGGQPAKAPGKLRGLGLAGSNNIRIKGLDTTLHRYQGVYQAVEDDGTAPSCPLLYTNGGRILA
jgi:hypothetical protein